MLPFLHQNNTAFNSYHKINYLEVACTFFSGNVSRYFRGEGHWTKFLFTSKQCKHSRGLYWKEDLEELEESPALAGSRTYNLKGSRPQDKIASTRPLCPDWKEMLTRLNILRH